jgi:hypothetical protein
MSETISYYKIWIELKQHFTEEKFIYGQDEAGVVSFRWNKEPERRKEYFREFRREYSISMFQQLIISNLIYNPKIFYMNLKNPEAIQNFKDFRKFYSNYYYYFKKDLETFKKYHIDIFELVDQKLVRIETAMFLNKLGYLILDSEKYNLTIKKYSLLMKDKLEWIKIHSVWREAFNKL